MKTLIFKPLASTAFLVFAWKMGALESEYGRLVFVALGLSWIGDIFLISVSSKAFLAGLIAFFFAHVAFGWAFLVRGVAPVWTFMAGLLLVFVGFAVSLWLMPRVKRNAPGMIIPVLAYMTVITAMVALAAGAAGGTGDFRILAGALMFYVSDLSVARDKFVAPGRINKAWGLPLYYAAQFVLAWTVKG